MALRKTKIFFLLLPSAVLLALTIFFIRDEITKPRRSSLKIYSSNGTALISGINRHTIYEPTTNFKDYSIASYLSMLHDSNIQIIRVFIPEGAPRDPCGTSPKFEDSLGSYNNDYIRKIDELFRLATLHHVYIILSIFDAYPFNECWGKTAYSKLSHKSEDFLQDENIKVFEKKRIRFIVSRYKDEQSLLAWEPINEIKNVAPGWFDSDREKASIVIAEWFEDMAREIKGIDQNHPITQSVGGGVIIPRLLRSNYLDIIQPHLWTETENPKNIANLINSYIDILIQYGKPIIIGEFGTRATNPLREDFIRSAIETGKKRGVPVLLWTQADYIYGDIDQTLSPIYKEVYNETNR